jgi:hypothetical protein
MCLVVCIPGGCAGRQRSAPAKTPKLTPALPETNFHRPRCSSGNCGAASTPDRASPAPSETVRHAGCKPVFRFAVELFLERAHRGSLFLIRRSSASANSLDDWRCEIVQFCTLARHSVARANTLTPFRYRREYTCDEQTAHFDWCSTERTPGDGVKQEKRQRREARRSPGCVIS